MLAARRARLAVLLRQEDLDADATVAPEAATVLKDIAGGDSRFARLDREMLALVYSSASPEEQERSRSCCARSPSPQAEVFRLLVERLVVRRRAGVDAHPG